MDYKKTVKTWLKGGAVLFAFTLLSPTEGGVIVLLGMFFGAVLTFALFHTVYKAFQKAWDRINPSSERAQAVGIANFLLALVIGAVVSWITTSITDPLISGVKETGTDPVATQSTNWIVIYLNNQPVVFLITAFFSLVALSIFQREVLG